MKKTVYSYERWDGTRVDLSAMLDHMSKAEVARLAGQEQRRQRLISAIEALFKAGELETVAEVLGGRYNVKVAV
jgi:hypothetical protein